MKLMKLGAKFFILLLILSACNPHGRKPYGYATVVNRTDTSTAFVIDDRDTVIQARATKLPVGAKVLFVETKHPQKMEIVTANVVELIDNPLPMTPGVNTRHDYWVRLYFPTRQEAVSLCISRQLFTEFQAHDTINVIIY